MSERLLFLIPARGGSKGLPGKNVLEVGGIPLVGRAARLGCATARVVGPGSRVVCSTDDAAIADAARAWGAEVPFVRPASLSSDRFLDSQGSRRSTRASFAQMPLVSR